MAQPGARLRLAESAPRNERNQTGPAAPSSITLAPTPVIHGVSPFPPGTSSPCLAYSDGWAPVFILILSGCLHSNVTNINVPKAIKTMTSVPRMQVAARPLSPSLGSLQPSSLSCFAEAS
jgi:hypothetical protein